MDSHPAAQPEKELVYSNLPELSPVYPEVSPTWEHPPPSAYYMDHKALPAEASSPEVNTAAGYLPHGAYTPQGGYYYHTPSEQQPLRARPWWKRRVCLVVVAVVVAAAIAGIVAGVVVSQKKKK